MVALISRSYRLLDLTQRAAAGRKGLRVAIQTRLRGDQAVQERGHRTPEVAYW